jgi:MFS family permease
MNSRRRYTRLASVALAGSNLGAVSLLLLLPTLIASDQQYTVYMSVLVVSVQAGQSVVVQLGRSFTDRTFRVSAPSVVIVAIVAILQRHNSETVLLSSALLALAGVVYGVFVGSKAQLQLQSGSPVRYQLTILLRSVVWILVMLAGSAAMSLSPLWSTALAWGVTAVLTRRGKATTDTTVNWRLLATVAFGAAAGLLYRNDVSLARASALGVWFSYWNVAILVYTIAQSLLGFIVVNELFARRQRVLEWYRGKRAVVYRFVLLAALPVIWICVFSAAIYTGNIIVVVALQTAPLIVGGLLIGLQAAFVHISHNSAIVYVGGIIGFAVLVLAYAIGAGPAVGLASELVVSGSVVALLASTKKARRREHEE